jgi:redox-sensitive bicupin YhaK (pirin superfamily)
MQSERSVAKIIKAEPALEGAGVRLHRGFGFGREGDFDPFLLFDDFCSAATPDHAAGFPHHPHRGIQTVTYVLEGEVTHRDSLGNRGTIGQGDVQWMSAGRGIIHEEMPAPGPLVGFQLWVNLPRSLKLSPPRYEEVKFDAIPVVKSAGADVRVIAGTYEDVTGPVQGVFGDPQYLDVALGAAETLTVPVPHGHTLFLYVISGSLALGPASSESAAAGMVVLYERTGEAVTVTAGSVATRFLVISGPPLGEPVAWHGPIVMNTELEIMAALSELRAGTFIKSD